MEVRSPPPPPDPVYTFRPYAGEIKCVGFTDILRDHPAVLAGTSTGLVSFWNLVTKRQIWTAQFDQGLVAVQPLASNKLLSQCRGGEIHFSDIETNRHSSVHTHYNGFCRLSILPHSFTPGNEHIALANEELGKINIFDCSTGSKTALLSSENSAKRGMCSCVRSFSGAHHHVTGGFEDGSVALWDLRKPDQELSSLKLFSDPVMCMDFDCERRLGVCGSPSQILETFSLTENVVTSLEKSYSIALQNAGISDVAIRHDHKIIVSGGWDGRIRIFGMKRGKHLAVLNYHTAIVHAVSFGSSTSAEYSNLVLCGSKDQRMSIWKIY